MTDIVYDTVTLPDAVVGVAYEAALAYHGNASAMSAASISNGALPTGLAIDAALPFSRITGTPKGNQAGTYTFKVTLTDTAGAVQSGSYTLNVRRSPAAEVLNSGGQTVLGSLARQWPSQY
jgi:hypothetical protein